MEALNSEAYLQRTTLLDFDSLAVQRLIGQRGWRDLPSTSDRIAAAYHFVKDEILYGYTPNFQIPASKVLKQGIGSSLAKTTLLLALLRALEIPCRLQADMVDKVVHRGLLGPLAFKLCPSDLFHTAVQLLYNNRWITVEGYVIDQAYVSQLQAMFPDYSGSFYGYGIAVLNFRNPDTRWEERPTSIQAKAVVNELGLFNDSDSFFKAYPEAQQRTRSFFYTKLFMPRLNKRIAAIRGTGDSVESRIRNVSALKRW